MKLLRIAHTLIGVALVAYLILYWLQENINFAYTGSLVGVFGVCFILLIVILLYKARQLDSLHNKRMMVGGGVALILSAYRGLTDTHNFRGSDMSIVFGVITFFFSLFGVFSRKKGDSMTNKGVYSKKTEIIEA